MVDQSSPRDAAAQDLHPVLVVEDLQFHRGLGKGKIPALMMICVITCIVSHEIQIYIYIVIYIYICVHIDIEIEI